MSAILMYLPSQDRCTVTSQEFFNYYNSDLEYDLESFSCDCCGDTGHDLALIPVANMGEFCPSCLKEHIEESFERSDIAVFDIFEARSFVSKYPIFAGKRTDQVNQILKFIDIKAKAIWKGNYRMIVKGGVETNTILTIVRLLREQVIHPDTITQAPPEPDYDNQAQEVADAYYQNS